MIPFDFEYYKPEALKEAVDLYSRLEDEGKRPVWYGGGSELLSMARVGNACFGAVIDIKKIPDCRALGEDGDYVVFGASLTLSDIIASKKFSLLEKTAGRIADHTMQNKITLGGNLAATIIYRETALPLLLSDAVIITTGKNGRKNYPIHMVFDGKLQLPRGELLVQTAVLKRFTQAPFFHVKKTKNEKLDYPVLTTAALVADEFLRISFSGLAAYPVRDLEVELILNNRRLTIPERADAIAEALSGILLTDMNGSAEYRAFVLKNTVVNILHAVREAEIPCLC